MSKTLTADDGLPIVASLTPQERARLFQLIAASSAMRPTSLYRALPPAREEFSTDEEPLAWEGEGWDDFK
jgi:hypothetical protein